MIDVQVRTQYNVDLFGPEPGGAQIGEIRVMLEVVALLLGAMLVVTATSVDEDRVPRRPDDEGMEGVNQITGR